MSSTVALLGNPNCGKTSLFNRLTGVSQRVGNWPGVTVERKEGRYEHAGREIVAVDLPGVYWLDAGGEGGRDPLSEDGGRDALADEGGLDVRIALEYLLGGEPDAVVNVVDESNVERNLYLTVQLLELDLPVVVALTMGDVPAARRRPVDAAALAERLGCQVVSVNPRRGRGVAQLRDAVVAALLRPDGPRARPSYPCAVEAAVDALREPLAADVGDGAATTRWRALALLSGDVRPGGPH